MPPRAAVGDEEGAKIGFGDLAMIGGCPLLLLLILASNSRRNDESNVEERTEACGMDVLLLSRAAA